MEGVMRRRRLSEVTPEGPFPVLTPYRASTKAPALASTRTPYRMHFTIIDKCSSWLRRSPSYRCVEWVFGLAETSIHGALETTEHHVEFTWANKKHKKRKRTTRVFWNKRDITGLVRKRSYGSGKETTLEYSWGIKGGETIMVFFNFSEAVTSERNRYGLCVDGDTFTNFPTLRDLETAKHDSAKLFGMDDSRSPEDDDSTIESQTRDLQHAESCSEGSIQGAVEYPKTIAPGTELSFRLSMAGLDRRITPESSTDIKDELHSDLFSPVLESVREQITHYLPQADHLVSRAITNAFCAEESSLNSSDATSISLMSGDAVSALCMEANMLKDAYEYSSKSNTKECAKLNFLQRRIDELFMGIRNDWLEPEEVSRIALNVAVQLGFHMTEPLPTKTVLINGIPPGTSEDELLLAFSRFGEMESVAIASSRRFGFCRFAQEVTAHQAVEAFEKEQLARNSSNDDDGPSLVLLEGKTH